MRKVGSPNGYDRGGGLWTLCGIVINGEVVLLKTSGTLVHEVIFYDYVGAGDSSLIRYMTPMFLFKPVTVKAASFIATYFVAKAKAFVDGCGGDTGLIQLMNDGRLRSGAVTDQDTLMAEFQLKEFVYALIDSSSSKEERDVAEKRFLDSIRLALP
jgi:hypothetical protein